MSGAKDLAHLRICPREIPPPAGENAGVRDDAVCERRKFNLSHYRMRAEYGLRTPGALQVATAIHSSATAFIANDATFRRVAGVQIIVLDDLL